MSRNQRYCGENKLKTGKPIETTGVENGYNSLSEEIANIFLLCS